MPQATPRERPPPVELDVPPPPPPTSPPPRPSPSRVRVLVGLAGGASLGAVDAAAPALWLRVGLRVSRWSIAAEVRGDLPVSHAIAGLADARVESSALAGALVACAHFGVASACALAGAGGVYRSASGVAAPSPGAEPWAFAGARGGLAWALSPRWSLTGAVDVLAALVRPVPSLATEAGQTTALWSPWPVHVAVAVGAQAALP